MTGPDLSAHCFSGDHGDCKFPRCQCPCHGFEDIYREPGPYPTVPAFKDEEQPSPDQPQET